MEDYSVVGKRIPNLDSIEKVKGSAAFTSDIRLNGMLYARILRSPFPHAIIHNIDTSKAEKLKGVKAVITAKDTPLVKYGMFVPDKMVIENEKVRFIGDEIVAVAAMDKDQEFTRHTGKNFKKYESKRLIVQHN
jgi:4-hydroxybenzoyl-CoA reductase subunit alpha